MDDFANDQDFRGAVDLVLRALLDQIDAIDSDEPDARLTSGNLAVTFESGGTFVLSQQTPTHELWLSANLRAWHFRRVGGAWLERDTREPMPMVLGALFAEKLAMPVTFGL